MTVITNRVQSNLATGNITLQTYALCGSTRCEFTHVWCICDPVLGERGIIGASDNIIQRVMVIFYRLSIVTIILYNWRHIHLPSLPSSSLPKTP